MYTSEGVRDAPPDLCTFHLTSWAQHPGWDGQSLTLQCHSREPHLRQINRAEAWGSLTGLTGHFFIRPLDMCWRKYFACVEVIFFSVFSFQIAGKPALKNKACIEIDCFPVAVPVVLWGATKLLIFTLGFILLFTVDFS